MSEHILQKASGKGWYWVHIEEADGKSIRHDGAAPTRETAKTGLEEFKIAKAEEARKLRALASKARSMAEADADKKHGTYTERRKARDAFEGKQTADYDATRKAALAKHRKALGLPAKSDD